MTQIDFQSDHVDFKVTSVIRSIVIDKDDKLDNYISFKFKDGSEIVYELTLSILDLMEALETGEIRRAKKRKKIMRKIYDRI